MFPFHILWVSLLGASHGLSVAPKTGGAGFGASKTSWRVHAPDVSAETQRLMSVLSSFPGADSSNVEIGFSPDATDPGGKPRRGLFAVKHVNKGKVICKVPSDLALALSDPNQAAMAMSPATLGANFWNMYYNNPQAREQWSWYLETLPDFAVFSTQSTPDCWSPEEIELLELPRAVRSALERKQQIEQVSAEQMIDAQALQFAAWLVSSRSFSVALSPDGSTANTEEEVMRDERGQVLLPVSHQARPSIQVMVPLLDMVNCNTLEANCRWTILDPEKDDAFFALEATRPISPGKEITLAYGSGGAPYSSVELLGN